MQSIPAISRLPAGLLVLTAAVLLAVVIVACGEESEAAVLSIPEGGDPTRGRAAIQQYGCGSCHTIPGVSGANGNVGPPLTAFGDRLYIAGAVANTPENLIQWIINPDSIEPGTLMPIVGASEEDATDIAAYLATLH